MSSLADQLNRWPISPPVSLIPTQRSENRVFHVVDSDARRFILRVHRPGYHDVEAIRSELDWIMALGRDTSVLVPTIVLTRDGAPIAQLDESAGCAPCLAVLFDEHPGDLPDETDPRLPEIFEALGETAAQCHLHALGWTPPPGFSRPSWTISNMLDPGAIWGNWRNEPDLDAADIAVLGEAQSWLKRQFRGYGEDNRRFGLIHNDMRPSNFLWHENRLRLIDFDDCGFGWFVADFAASVSWFETDPRLPSLFRRWRTGYERHRPLDSDDIASVDAAVMARRMLLLAWSVSRADTDLAELRAKGFAEDTVALARRFLDGEALV